MYVNHWNTNTLQNTQLNRNKMHPIKFQLNPQQNPNQILHAITNNFANGNRDGTNSVWLYFTTYIFHQYRSVVHKLVYPTECICHTNLN